MAGLGWVGGGFRGSAFEGNAEVLGLPCCFEWNGCRVSWGEECGFGGTECRYELSNP